VPRLSQWTEDSEDEDYEPLKEVENEDGDEDEVEEAQVATTPLASPVATRQSPVATVVSALFRHYLLLTTRR